MTVAAADALLAPRAIVRGRTTRARRVAAAAAFLLAAAWCGAEALVRWGGLVDVDRFVRTDGALRVQDRDGALLRVVRRDGGDHRWVAIEDVSPNLIAAVLAAEDARFFAHDGVDRRAVLRAALGNLLPWRRRSGASTITQQLVKRVYGRPNGLWDKGMEVLRARALERVVSKDEILEQYLNRLPYGDGIEGVARACEAYLGHGPERVSVAEAALIAGIPQAPGRTEPRRHLARALARRNAILDRMRAAGRIDETTWRAARIERPAIASGEVHPSQAMRFTDELVRRWRARDLVAPRGVVRSSLDAGLQREVEALVRSGVERSAGRGARNGAAVVVRNATGEVFAYVGAADESGEGGAMDLLRRPRQPGSTLKPFVYERFFETGATPATVVADVAGRWGGHLGAQYEARDYDGRERGPVRARVALAASLNLAALDAAGRVGQDALVARLRALGFRRAEDPAALGAAVVLGGMDVTPLELASAYVTLARGGTRVPLAWTPTPTQTGVRVMDPASAAMTLDVLRDPDARAQGFGSSLEALAPGGPFALKTGTSSGWRDAWCAVSDARWTVVVWLGDPRGAPMAALSGFEAAAPVAVRALAAARRVEGVEGAAAPEVAMRDVDVCAHSGLRAGPRCHHVLHERMPRDRALPEVCAAHDAQGRDVVGARYASWVARHHPAVTVAREGDAPLRVLAPMDGARLLVDPSGAARVPLRASESGVRWRVDGAEVPAAWRAAPGAHAIEAATEDGRRASVTVTVAAY